MSEPRVCHRGGCHCGAVQFEIMASPEIHASRCNCSICRKSGYIHLIVNREDFKLLRGSDDLSEYRFNTGTARHLFCRHCGIKSFYVPRSHPEGYSVNVHCLETHNILSVSVSDFDGQNWEASIDAYRTDIQSD